MHDAVLSAGAFGCGRRRLAGQRLQPSLPMGHPHRGPRLVCGGCVRHLASGGGTRRTGARLGRAGAARGRHQSSALRGGRALHVSCLCLRNHSPSVVVRGPFLGEPEPPARCRHGNRRRPRPEHPQLRYSAGIGGALSRVLAIEPAGRPAQLPLLRIGHGCGSAALYRGDDLLPRCAVADALLGLFVSLGQPADFHQSAERSTRLVVLEPGGGDWRCRSGRRPVFEELEMVLRHESGYYRRRHLHPRLLGRSSRGHCRDLRGRLRTPHVHRSLAGRSGRAGTDLY